MTPWIVLATLPLLAGADPSPAAAKPAGKRAAAGRSPWTPLDEAVASARKDYRPLLIVYLPAAPEAPAAAEAGGEAGAAAPAGADFVKEVRAALADPEVKKVLRVYACADIDRAALDAPYPPAPAPAAPPPSAAAADAAKAAGAGKAAAKDRRAKGDPASKKAAKTADPPADPATDPPADPAKPPDPAKPADAAKPAEAAPTAGRKLGISPAEPAVVVLDFRERVVRRYAGKFPRTEAFRKELRAIAVECDRLAAIARKVEKVVEDAEYSYKLGETRKAVIAVRDYDDPNVQRTFDPVLAERVTAVIARYKKDAATAIASGDALDKARRYLDAVMAYVEAAKKYPFTDVIRESNKKQGASMRRAQGFGPP